ncbi:MAG: ADYC domain-containing protein [Nannocystaceae bacterium]|nr:hypothetical protein [Myxococcales bacterium]
MKTTNPRTRRALQSALIVCALAACDDAPTLMTDEGAVEFRSLPKWNTNILLGHNVPFVDTSGEEIGDVKLAGVEVWSGGQYQPITLASLEVVHGEVRGVGAVGLFAGEEFEGSLWHFEVKGQPLLVTLATVTNAGSEGYTVGAGYGADPERLLYHFVYFDPNTQVTVSTCTDPDDGGFWMVLDSDFAIDGVTGDVTARANTIDFACLSSAMGKPWLYNMGPNDPDGDGFSLLTEYETATRMFRADYCKSGKSYTKVGMPLGWADVYGYNDLSGALGWSTEALWEFGGGATCVNIIRRTGKVLNQPLQCADGTIIPLCGTEAEAAAAWLQGDADIWTMVP